MRRLLTLLLLLGCCASCCAQQTNFGSSGAYLGAFLVSKLPSSGIPNPALAFATDSNGGSCTVGSSTTLQLCQWNGTAWSAIGGGGAPSGAAGGVLAGTYPNPTAAPITAAGFFGGFGINTPPYPTTSGTAGPAATANQVFVLAFTLPVAMSIDKVVYDVAAGNGAGDLWGYGIYSFDGLTKYIATGALSTAAAGVQSATITPVVLQPGEYFFAQTSSGTTATSPYDLVEAAYPQLFINQNRQRYGLAANASAAGVLPATLGAISNTVRGTMLVWFEN